MKRIQQSMVLAGLLALGLAGCKSTTGSGGSADMTGAGSTSSGSSSTGGSMGSGGTAGAPPDSSSMGATQGMPGQTSQGAPGSSMASAPNAVVTLIEVVPRQSAGGDATGSSAVGGTGTTGTTGSSMGADQVYRVTMLMDDGSTQVVMLDQAPTFRSGDRVNMSGGNITH